MFKTKLFSSIILISAVLFAQVGAVAAAPEAQDGTTTLTGTITGIETQMDATGETIVVVTIENETGAQTLNLSAQEAADDGLLNLETQELLAQMGDTVELVVDAADLVPNEEPTAEEVHPIAWLLAEFFDEDPGVVNDYHEDGFGFGVIAQALWMSQNLTGTEEQDGDASLAGDILQAKQDKDFEAFFDNHPEYLENFDGSLPTNWGQFRKSLLEKKNNLGVIVSGQEDPENSNEVLNPQDYHGNNRENGRDHGKGKDKQKKRP